jgi:hypothetical protein
MSWRSVVGAASTSGSELNATRPTLNCEGSRLRNACMALTAASSRVGSTSFARIEPETSTRKMTIPFCCGTLSDACGRARAADAQASASRRRASGSHRRTERRSSTRLARSSTFVYATG